MIKNTYGIFELRKIIEQKDEQICIKIPNYFIDHFFIPDLIDFSHAVSVKINW